MDQSSTRLLAPENPPPLNADGEAELLKSENIALRVIDKLQLTADSEYNPKSEEPSRIITGIKEILSSLLNSWGLQPRLDEDPSSLQDISGVQALPPEKAAALQRLKQNITIRRRGLTDLLAVEAKSEEPRRAARIANAYAQAYLDEQVAIKAQALNRAEQILSRQLAELNEELKRSEAQIGLRQSYQESLVRLRAIAQRRETLSADARIVSPARPPGGPAFPSARTLGAVGIVFSTAVGLALALGLAAYREAKLDRAYTEEEVTAASGVTNLAVIPSRRTRLLWSRRSNRMEKKSLEAKRRLFFNMQLIGQQDSKLSVWLITSSQSSEERAALGLSLVRLAGASGLKAALVDADLRHPIMHDLLGVENDKGLADLLLARSDVQGVVQDAPESDYKFISAGFVGDTQVERYLRPERLKNAMRKLRLEFDIVLLVAPPFDNSADPLMLMGMADAALFIVRSGETLLCEMRSNVRQLRRCSEKPVYTVMMDAPART
ncbi:MAG TPA: hypothetical protein VEZ24_08140 [Microvirga sp.]|nr:hypothetical protein [Microvirga sp.]